MFTAEHVSTANAKTCGSRVAPQATWGRTLALRRQRPPTPVILAAAATGLSRGGGGPASEGSRKVSLCRRWSAACGALATRRRFPGPRLGCSGPRRRERRLVGKMRAVVGKMRAVVAGEGAACLAGAVVEEEGAARRPARW
jgi:hypothetical protein